MTSVIMIACFKLMKLHFFIWPVMPDGHSVAHMAVLAENMKYCTLKSNIFLREGTGVQGFSR